MRQNIMVDTKTKSSLVGIISALASIRQDNPFAAVKFRDRAENILQRFEDFPESGRILLWGVTGCSFCRQCCPYKTMAILAGPIGWVIAGIWTAIDIAGPAYRVTIPTVIQAAVLRQKHLYEKQAEENIANGIFSVVF